jgi:hypothetical protein
MGQGVNIPALLKGLFTEQDNQTWCPVRLFGIAFAILGSTVFLGLAVWTVVLQHNALRYVSFGAGLSAVWATVSAAIVFKAKFGERK